MDPRERLERLIMGLEMAIPENRARLQYMDPKELEYRYTQKFLAAMEENLARARRELEELERKEAAG